MSQSSFAIFRRILRIARPYRLLYIIGFLFLGAEVALNIGIAFMQKIFVDTIEVGDLSRLFSLIWIFAAAVLVVFSLDLFGHFLRECIKQWMGRDLVIEIFDKLNTLPFAYLQKVHSADLIARLNQDAPSVIVVVGGSLFQLVNQGANSIVAFFYLAQMDLPLALLVVGAGPITFLSGRFFDKRLRKISKEVHTQMGLTRGIMQETIQGLAVAKAFGLEETFIARYTRERTEQRRLERAQTLYRTAMWQSAGNTNQLIMLVAVYFITQAAVAGRMSVGSVLAFISLMGAVQWPFVGLSHIWGNVQQGLGAAERMYEVLDHESEGVGGTPSGRMVSQVALELQNVSFSYGEESLFSDLSLRLDGGETVALVGPSGSGKTTLARICCGLYPVSQGKIEVFGLPMSELYEARRKIAYVPQEPYLFAGTIRENIAYGIPQATSEEIEQAARAANAHAFINSLEKGYETPVGEHGTALSGGQRQRIAIARAFLRKAPLVILDEATSSLDNESEHLVQASMDRLLQERTALVIAHRLSTIRNADRILVLDQGRIVEEGTHEELLRDGSLYSRLYQLQFQEGTSA